MTTRFEFRNRAGDLIVGLVQIAPPVDPRRLYAVTVQFGDLSRSDNPTLTLVCNIYGQLIAAPADPVGQHNFIESLGRALTREATVTPRQPNEPPVPFIATQLFRESGFARDRAIDLVTEGETRKQCSWGEANAGSDSVFRISFQGEEANRSKAELINSNGELFAQRVTDRDGGYVDTSFDTANQRPWSWRDTVVDSQNRPIQTTDHVDWDRVGNGQTQVRQMQEYARNSRPIGEPVQQVVAPNGAPPAQQPQVVAEQAIGSYLGPALGQAPAAARERASEQAADPGAAIPADNATAATARATEDDSAAAATSQAEGVEPDQAGNEGNRAAGYRQQAIAAHLARIDQAKQRIPDFDQVIRSGGRVPIAPGVADEILNSEKSALLQYHLAGNPAKLDELNGLSGLNLAREIGRLEGRLYLPPARTATEASPPLSDVRGSAAPVFDPHTTDDMDAFADWLREDQARRRRA